MHYFLLRLWILSPENSRSHHNLYSATLTMAMHFNQSYPSIFPSKDEGIYFIKHRKFAVNFSILIYFNLSSASLRHGYSLKHQTLIIQISTRIGCLINENMAMRSRSFRKQMADNSTLSKILASKAICPLDLWVKNSQSGPTKENVQVWVSNYTHFLWFPLLLRSDGLG